MWVCLLFRTGDNVSLVDVRTAFSMIGKFGITGAFNIVYLYGPEIFPTTLRSRWLASSWAYLECLVVVAGSNLLLFSFPFFDVQQHQLGIYNRSIVKAMLVLAIIYPEKGVVSVT